MILRPTRIKKLGSYFIAAAMPAATTLLSFGTLTPYAIAISAGIIANAEVSRLRYKYKITDKELHNEAGLLRKERTSVQLKDIVKINVKQGFIERLMSYGHLELETKSTPVNIYNIRKPKTIAERIKELKKDVEAQWNK